MSLGLEVYAPNFLNTNGYEQLLQVEIYNTNEYAILNLF
jgi:hypothetical protein